MDNINDSVTYLKQPFPIFFTLGLILVNTIAVFNIDMFYIGAFFAFLYIIVTPGLLLLPFFTSKKIPTMLSLAMSVALSLFLLMMVGLIINTVLPYFGIIHPLTTIPLLATFDALIYTLLVLNFDFKKSLPFEIKNISAFNWTLIGVACIAPICAFVGAMILNNGGKSTFAMIPLILTVILIPIVVLSKDKINSTTPPIILYLLALSFLFANSMRGLFVSGHDILLEFHVFNLTNNAHVWKMALFRDPYMACLSLTILPTYFQQLLHITPASIFKFFIQFIGALPVIVIYYLAKEYVNEKMALLVAFMYISFPTFLIDMAFLNRQGIAFLFFSILLYIVLASTHFEGYKKTILLFTIGIGVIISHYSTSYVGVAVLLGTYIINRLMRLIVTAKRPFWLNALTNKLKNKEEYFKPITLTFPLVAGLLLLMLIWSTFITKTSTSLFNTIKQIGTTIQHPFSLDQLSGQAHYSLVQSKKQSPQQLLNEFREEGIKHVEVTKFQSEFYPIALTRSYPAIAIAEVPAPLTPFGTKFQSLVHFDLATVFNFFKQTYAKIIQIILLIGLWGLLLGATFRKNLLRNVPVEYLALSIAGLSIMVGQTILPASAIDYGLLRLFQQNLIFLSLPIILGLMLISSIFTRHHRAQLAISTGVILFFFVILSGLFPQLTGGGRPQLPLANAGLYYDSYYTHAQEVSSISWLSDTGEHYLPIQAAHFSDMKMLAFGQIGAYIELLPETTKKKSYVYLNYDNALTSNILEIVNGNVVYYHFPLEFLNLNKDLIYNNGGSMIYR